MTALSIGEIWYMAGQPNFVQAYYKTMTVYWWQYEFIHTIYDKNLHACETFRLYWELEDVVFGLLDMHLVYVFTKSIVSRHFFHK